LAALDAAPLGEDGLWGSASRRDEGLGWRLAAEDAITSRGEPADEPVRLDGIVHPWGGPAVGHARFNRLLRHFAAVTVEKRQLPASLCQSALEIASLRVGRPYANRNMTGQILTWRGGVGAVLALWCSAHGRPAVNDD
jgi:hypothetical protein